MCFLKKSFITIIQLSLVLTSASGLAHQKQQVNEKTSKGKPNIVWLVSEDNSSHYLAHFFKGGAKAPNIEALAETGITFDNAFSNGAVCSVARTTLATGVYAPKLAAQYHRKMAHSEPKNGFKFFHQYLREAGYFTANNAKTDYNILIDDNGWSKSKRKSSWQDREHTEQPFFYMESKSHTHEGSLHFKKMTPEKLGHDPKAVTLPDYLQDTEISRYTYAHYLDRMVAMDDWVGSVVSKLAKDNLLDDTFVFYFGDHGGVLPRSKGYLFDSGLRVPLVVHIPKNYAHLTDFKQGSRTAGIVDFVDLSATAINLAGIPIPEHLDGTPFLGVNTSAKMVAESDESIAYADRFDEKVDLIRSLRKGKYLYNRNYQPHLPHGAQNQYRYRQMAYRDWREQYQLGKLNAAQSQFFEPKQLEELYDVENDPHQVNNLAGKAEYKALLVNLRQSLQRQLKAMPDLGFYPESYLLTHAFENPTTFSQQQQKDIAKLITIADMALQPFDQVKQRLAKLLTSKDVMQQFWAIKTAATFKQQAKSLSAQITALLKADNPYVKYAAAEYLAQVEQSNMTDTLIALLNATNNEIFAVEVMGSLTFYQMYYGKNYQVDPSKINLQVESTLNIRNQLKFFTQQFNAS
ncbi:sulfatase-like hydrolase/transferase [Thalassotalea fonticola]|uniref:Sulfatase-like hydrolase/transferase n=1 Tax=Thalassotalea fonticola TaxID=3065649 RepID=A0ABZ0GME9_9GAMM|nr:sulfatase-like hydrolase/transferase [Colwelliaceae bacterium S1-1]